MISPAPVRLDASADLAGFVAGLAYADLGGGVRESTKRCIIDTIGISNAALTCGAGHERLVRLVASVGGAPESTVIDSGLRAPAFMAALANGALARAVNFDDSHDEGSSHPSSVVVPAALATAERRGGVSGRELIAAVAAGNEVICRLGAAVARRPSGLPMDGWFFTSVFGIFGATAACCRVLGLDAAMTRHALGIALFECSGTLEAFSPSGQQAMTRGMISGMTAKSAVLATLMAEGGITGVPDSLEGRYGLFRVYFGGDYDRDALAGGLGKIWHAEAIGLKAWPTGRYTSAYIDAAAQTMRRHGIGIGDIAEIRVHVSGYVATRCEPLARQRRPENYNHAGHALPYLVAAMAARGGISIDDLASRLDDPVVLALAQRVVPVEDPAFGADDRIGPAKVVIELRDGTTHATALEFMYGDPRNPLTSDDLVAKLRGCLERRQRPLPAGQVDDLIAQLAGLERIHDVRDIMRRIA